MKRAGEEAELFRGGPETAPKSLGKGAGWSDLALAGDDVWLLNRIGNRGELLRSTSGAAPASVAGDLPGAGGLRAVEGRLFWIEGAPPAALAPPFVPVAGGTGRLRVREASGEMRTVAEWLGGQPGQSGDVVGVSNGQVYVRLHRPASTEFLRVPLTGGDWERLAIVNGTQEGLLMGDDLYWTAPTEEANKVDVFRCVRRLRASGAPETITDWLPAAGHLYAGTRTPVYLTEGLDAALYQLLEHLDQAQLLRAAPERASLDGTRLINLDGPNAPTVVPAGQR